MLFLWTDTETDTETGTEEKTFAQGRTGNKGQDRTHTGLDSVDPKPILFTAIQVLFSRSWEKTTVLSGKVRSLANPLLKGQWCLLTPTGRCHVSFQGRETTSSYTHI